LKGCIVAMNSFNFICSFWLDIDFEIRGLEKIEEASGPENKPVVLISNHQVSNKIKKKGNFGEFFYIFKDFTLSRRKKFFSG